MLDRLRVGLLVHPVQRLAVTAGEERTDLLVRQDHQLLDEHVSMRLAFEPRVGDAATAVEAKHRLRSLHLQGAACEAPAAQCGRKLFVQRQLLE